MYADWTTRELVHLLLLAAAHSKRVDVKELLTDLRAAIVQHELGPVEKRQ